MRQMGNSRAKRFVSISAARSFPEGKLSLGMSPKTVRNHLHSYKNKRGSLTKELDATKKEEKVSLVPGQKAKIRLTTSYRKSTISRSDEASGRKETPAEEYEPPTNEGAHRPK